MNYKDILVKKLKKYKKEDIIITSHAENQAIFRSIDLDEVKENIINPKRLYFAGKQKSERASEEKYDCYFGYSKTQCQRYILVINDKCIVCTVIKINRRWQHIVEKNAKVFQLLLSATSNNPGGVAFWSSPICILLVMNSVVLLG